MTQQFTCKHCGHTFTPKLWRWLCAMHLFDIWRYFKCDNCGKRSWMKRERK